MQSIVVLDDDSDLRDTLREIIESVFGAKCIAIGGLDEFFQLEEEILKASLAILDINLGPGARSGFDAYSWLREHRFAGRIVFLTGHAKNHPMVAKALSLGHADVLEKPVTLEVLQGLVANHGP